MKKRICKICGRVIEGLAYIDLLDLKGLYQFCEECYNFKKEETREAILRENGKI